MAGQAQEPPGFTVRVVLRSASSDHANARCIHARSRGCSVKPAGHRCQIGRVRAGVAFVRTTVPMPEGSSVVRARGHTPNTPSCQKCTSGNANTATAPALHPPQRNSDGGAQTAATTFMLAAWLRRSKLPSRRVSVADRSLRRQRVLRRGFAHRDAVRLNGSGSANITAGRMVVRSSQRARLPSATTGRATCAGKPYRTRRGMATSTAPPLTT